MSKPYGHQNSSQRGILIAVIIVLCVVLVAAAAFLIYLLRQNGDVLPTDPSKPSTSETTTVPTTSQVPPTSSVVTEPPIPEEVTALLQQADFIAAGYDYEKAISMLTESAYYSEYPLLLERVEAYREADSQLVVYKTPQNIPHVFFHSLIADTDRAFDGDGDAAGYNMNMTTIKEFNAILEQMYERGYVLISPYDMAHEVTDEAGTHFVYGKIRLPEGKKPFLMSQDDLNYYSYMIGTVVDKVNDGKGTKPIFVDKENDGFAHKLVIGEDGYPTCEYMDADGNITTGDYDLVPLLERFIQEHPDFSYHGARAILGVTGFEGVFGNAFATRAGLLPATPTVTCPTAANGRTAKISRYPPTGWKRTPTAGKTPCSPLWEIPMYFCSPMAQIFTPGTSIPLTTKNSRPFMQTDTATSTT